ncbi:helix-turn-helix domain-containing protein [Streptomyces sp. NPDC050617]|uniref:helix-turn-helix domain-containing protein n=1 Tax=Streptomyces sp. NPDC050617 TaxID=3154628 RepID=UPI00342A903D
MTERKGSALTFTEIFALPVVLDVRTAARAFGVSPGTAYKLIKHGGFPCEAVRCGRQHRISTASVLRALGIEERPVYAEDLEAGAAFAAELD